MKILEVEISKEKIKNNLEDLADIIRLKISKSEYAYLLDLVDFEDDNVFLEPGLFFYFLVQEKSIEAISPDQILWGHFKNKKQKNAVKVKSDSNGYIHLPNYGYLISNNNQDFDLFWNEEENKIHLFIEGKEVSYTYKPFQYLNNTSIKLCEPEADILKDKQDVIINEPINKTLEANKQTLMNAYEIMKNDIPEFCDLIELTNKEFMLFNGENQNSMASMQYYGTAFLNLNNKINNEVFYIEDLAHQCGHVIFFAVLLDADKFFKLDSRSRLNQFTANKKEPRDLYGAFHGLFTYTTILHALDEIVSNKSVEGLKLVEAYARMGFYLLKFKTDLAIFNNDKILSELGFKYYNMFKAGYDQFCKKNLDIIGSIEYVNQPYVFSWEKFVEENSNQEIFTNYANPITT